MRTPSPPFNTRARQLAALTLVAALACLVIVAQIPRSTQFMHVLHKTGHPLVFAVIALVLRSLLDTPASRIRERRFGPYLQAFVGALIIGALTEVAQLFTNRGSSVTDVVRDALGALAALCWHAALNPGPSGERSKQRRLVALMGGAAVIAAAAPLAWCVAAYANRALKFPAVLAPTSRLDSYFIANAMPVRLVTLPVPWAATAAEQALWSTTHPAVVYLSEPYPDWRRHRVLALDITNPNSMDLQLIVRVHDRGHNWRHNDRFNSLVRIAAHARSVVRLELEHVEAAPRARSMNMAAIAGVAVFVPTRTDRREFFLSGIWLE